MRRAALAVALLAAAALVTSAASAPVKAPGYLSETWGNFALFSNTHIKGSKAISPIAAKGAGPNGNLGKPTEPLGPIWLKTCPAGVQTVTFERELQLPGPPAALEVNYGVDRGSSMFPSPLHSIDFVANGKVFLHRPLGEGEKLGGHFKLDARQRKAFRVGENHFAVRVHKGASPHSLACNTSPETHLGIQFWLYGSFTTDLALVPGKDVYGAPAAALKVDLTARNDGPAAVPGGTFHVEVSGVEKLHIPTDEGVGGAFHPPGEPFEQCKVDKTTNTMDCKIGEFPPGQKGVFQFLAGVHKPTGDFSEYSVTVVWSLGSNGMSDSDSTNNRSSGRYIFCGKLSTLEGCKPFK